MPPETQSWAGIHTPLPLAAPVYSYSYVVYSFVYISGWVQYISVAPGEVPPRLSGFWAGRVNPRCWGEPRRDCISCFHSRLEVPRYLARVAHASFGTPHLLGLPFDLNLERTCSARGRRRFSRGDGRAPVRPQPGGSLRGARRSKAGFRWRREGRSTSGRRASAPHTPRIAAAISCS